MSGSLEFRPGRVLTDKQNEKVSSLATTIQTLFSPHPTIPPPPSFYFSNLIFSSLPSSLSFLPPAGCLTLLFIPVSVNAISFIFHYSPFTQFLLMFLLYLVFDIYVHLFFASPQLELHLFPFSTSL